MSEGKSNPAAWIDSLGRVWSTAISLNTIKRVRELVNVNLLEVFDGQLLNRLSGDPELLVNTLYAVCKPQADERGMSDEAFGELLVGDASEEATTALVQGLISFFPKDRREVLRRIWTKTGKLTAESMALITAKLDSANIDETIKAMLARASEEIDRELLSFRNASGNWRASSE